ncbi:hypothetical protein, partial [Gemmiger formicilis]|uniref:hypothetical protein n=1 Tax=Gemmiger formicilis TaxID=745368 RepID=UPI00195D44F7
PCLVHTKGIHTAKTLHGIDIFYNGLFAPHGRASFGKTGTLTDDTLQPEYYMDILGNECRKTLDYAYLASRYHT